MCWWRGGSSGGGGTLTNPTAVPTWVKAGTFLYSQFTTGADQSIYLGAALKLSRMAIHAVQIKHSIAFAGGALTSYAISVAAGVDQLTPGFDVMQAVAGPTYEVTGFSPPYMGNVDENASMTLRAVCEGANLNAATQGSVDVWLLISRYPTT